MPKSKRSILSDAHLQVKRFAAVRMSQLLWGQTPEEERLDEVSKNLVELQKTVIASDQATTMSPA
jgi:hypothetical protein